MNSDSILGYFSISTWFDTNLVRAVYYTNTHLKAEYIDQVTLIKTVMKFIESSQSHIIEIHVTFIIQILFLLRILYKVYQWIK